jgi:hypothetical protein
VKDLHISAGTADINGKAVHYEEQSVPIPPEPGHYGVYATDSGKVVLIKIADLTIPAPTVKDRSQKMAEWIGVGIGALIVGSAVAVGVTYLAKWLWGI